VPKVDSIEQLNAHLQDRCRADLVRTIRGKEKSKGALLEEERASLLPLPKQRFEAHLVEKTKATSLSLARFAKENVAPRVFCCNCASWSFWNASEKPPHAGSKPRGFRIKKRWTHLILRRSPR
jgi:hypothetical protein